MAAVTENIDPNLSIASLDAGGLSPALKDRRNGGKPPRSKKLRVSISPKKPTVLLSPGARRNRRRSSSHFGGNKKKKKALVDDTDDEEEDSDAEEEEEDSDIEFTLDGAPDIDTPKNSSTTTATTIDGPTPKNNGSKKKGQHQRRRRRSSARFLRLSSGGTENNNDADDSPSNKGEDFTSSEHLGEIYRQAISMNAQNKINAGNSWGLKLIENMDKFIGDDTTKGLEENLTPRSGNNDAEAREELKAARKMKSKDERGRINFTKASCTLDASVKIYSYRVDDVHLSSYRVLANLNRTDNKKDGGAVDVEGGEGESGEGRSKVTRKKTRSGPTETLENNLANINMSKLDSAYDIDPLFHKMSKSFDEGGAKGLLLGNLGVSDRGCHIVFDSKADDEAEKEEKLDKIDEEKEDGDENEEEKKEGDEEEEDFDITPEEATVWKESEIDITNLASKLTSMLASYGHRTSSSVPFVPQLESLRQDYTKLEGEGYGVDEHDATSGRKRLKLYDAPEEEEKEAERSIHVIAMERSRGSVLGMSFDTNFRLDDEDMEDGDVGGDFGTDFVGEGEFAPADDGSFNGGGEFEPDFGSGGGFDDAGDSQPGTFVNARSYANNKVLLDALCSGDAFYDNNAIGGNSDYAFFDMKKFEKATDGNLWAGSQHWKKKPVLAKNKDSKKEKKSVMFAEDGDTEEKKPRKRATKKERVFADFNNEAPEVDAIFAKKKTTKHTTKKAKKDAYQMPQTEKDFLLPPDANVDISQLTRLFSRPNAVVRRNTGNNSENPVGKTVGFYDVEDNALGFDDDDGGDFGGNNDGGFTFAYGEDDDDQTGAGNDTDYNTEDFDEVRKVEKIDINYATVAKKVDVRRLKKDLWTELEEKTAWVAPEEFKNKNEEEIEDDIFDEVDTAKKGDPQYVSFKETVEQMEEGQTQNDVTVSFYFICCLHLANEKGLKFDQSGLEDFVISLDDGSAPTFGNFGDGFSQTANKLAAVANSRGKREKKAASYQEDEEEDIDLEE